MVGLVARAARIRVPAARLVGERLGAHGVLAAVEDQRRGLAQSLGIDRRVAVGERRRLGPGRPRDRGRRRDVARRRDQQIRPLQALGAVLLGERGLGGEPAGIQGAQPLGQIASREIRVGDLKIGARRLAQSQVDERAAHQRAVDFFLPRRLHGAEIGRRVGDDLRIVGRGEQQIERLGDALGVVGRHAEQDTRDQRVGRHQDALAYDALVDEARLLRRDAGLIRRLRLGRLGVGPIRLDRDAAHLEVVREPIHDLLAGPELAFERAQHVFGETLPERRPLRHVLRGLRPIVGGDRRRQRERQATGEEGLTDLLVVVQVLDEQDQRPVGQGAVLIPQDVLVDLEQIEARRQLQIGIGRVCRHPRAQLLFRLGPGAGEVKDVGQVGVLLTPRAENALGSRRDRLLQQATTPLQDAVQILDELGLDALGGQAALIEARASCAQTIQMQRRLGWIHGDVAVAHLELNVEDRRLGGVQRGGGGDGDEGAEQHEQTAHHDYQSASCRSRTPTASLNWKSSAESAPAQAHAPLRAPAARRRGRRRRRRRRGRRR